MQAGADTKRCALCHPAAATRPGAHLPLPRRHPPHLFPVPLPRRLALLRLHRHAARVVGKRHSHARACAANACVRLRPPAGAQRGSTALRRAACTHLLRQPRQQRRPLLQLCQGVRQGRLVAHAAARHALLQRRRLLQQFADAHGDGAAPGLEAQLTRLRAFSPGLAQDPAHQAAVVQARGAAAAQREGAACTVRWRERRRR